jgi:eukaryotic-like serine/threonine-protein kinase
MQEDIKTPPVVADALTGTLVGRFVLGHRLGAGGMGQVFIAEDPTLKRKVAIKRAVSGAQSDPNDRKRFLKEAQRASALNHPNVGSMYDVVEHGGELWLVMEYIEGETLRNRLKRGPIPREDFFNIAAQCCEGLQAAREKDIIHGDIKPENIMLAPGNRVKILDFGVARRAWRDASPYEATRSMATMTVSGGTPAYMAPEVLLQKHDDGRSDIFSLGVVFYEMLGGEQPFHTQSLATTIARIVHEEPPPLKNVPAPLAAVVSHAMAKDPNARYPAPAALLEDLSRVQSGGKPRTPTCTTGSASSPRYRSFFAIVAALLLIVAAILFVGESRRARPNSATQAPKPAPTATIDHPVTLIVLPFEPVADDAKLTAFGNGLVDTLTAKLAQLSANHPLQVVSAGEIRLKNVISLAQAHQEFGADTGLRLGLERSGDLLRVSYSLTDAKTGKVTKAGSADVPVTDPFAIEDQITQAVSAALGFSLRADESRELAFHGTSMPEAFNYYTQARGYLEDSSKAANVDSAIILFQQALKVDPNYGRAEADLGSAYWRKYNASKDEALIPKSRDACLKAIDLGNSGADGHVCMGVIDNGTGKYEDAAKQFQSAVELDPSNEDAYIGLGKAYELLGKPQDAESTYKKMIASRPNYWLGYNVLGAFYLSQAQYDDASKMFQKVVALTPEGFRGYANLGATLLYQAKYADAIKPLEQSLAIHATADTYTNVGTAYYYQRRYQDAAQAYQKAVQMNDKDYTLWGNLAEAYYLDGERQKARTAYEKAIALAKPELAVNNRDPPLLNALAKYSAMIDDRAQSFAYLSKAVEGSKSDKEVLFSAATIYNHFGDKGQALEWLGKALRAGYSPEMARQQPDLDNLHGDARFEDLLKSTGPGPNPAK